MSIINVDNVIVGAGLSGLYLGQLLRSMGKSCLILEKSHGIGGRVATRRINHKGFDHGASYLSMPANFEELLKTLSLRKCPQQKNYLLNGGMNQLAKTLAQDLSIFKQSQLKTIKQSSRGWKMWTHSDVVFDCHKLILSAPLPQGLSLLAENHLVEDALHPIHHIEYSKALVSMLIFEELPEELESFQFRGHDFIFMRERELHPRGLVIRFNAEVSELFFELPEEKIQIAFNHQLQLAGLGHLSIEKSEIKKWRYALPKSIYPSPYLEYHPGLFLMGDAFGHPFLSAEEVSRQL